jgi:hypothetical protein
MTTPNQRSLWWDERVRQEEKSLVKLIRACKKHAKAKAERGDGGAGGLDDAERRVRRHDLARRVHETEKQLTQERIARFKADAEVMELSAMVEKIDERLTDPVVLNAKKSSGGAVAGLLYPK